MYIIIVDTVFYVIILKYLHVLYYLQCYCIHYDTQFRSDILYIRTEHSYRSMFPLIPVGKETKQKDTC